MTTQAELEKRAEEYALKRYPQYGGQSVEGRDWVEDMQTAAKEGYLAGAAEREAGRGEKRMDENRIARMCDDFEAQRIKDGLTPFAAEQETDGYERGLCHAKDFYESHPTPDAEKGEVK